jgi:AmmeMemoRadiSam system protein B
MKYARNPVVAGSFYYDDPDILKDQLREFYSKARAKENCTGVVSPHAGYTYSGLTAAFAMASLNPAKSFLILGPNHTGLGEAFSIYPEGSWKTPLGECQVDSELAGELKAEFPGLKDDVKAHQKEHSIEVQLPFLQSRFRDFRFLPVALMCPGYMDDNYRQQLEGLGTAIAKLAKKKSFGIIASSDFSHYLPVREAEHKDEMALQKILRLDTKGFFEVLQKTGASICGFAPITVLMTVAKRLDLKARVIHRSNSGESSCDFSSVVTYKAIGFYR